MLWIKKLQRPEPRQSWGQRRIKKRRLPGPRLALLSLLLYLKQTDKKEKETKKIVIYYRIHANFLLFGFLLSQLSGFLCLFLWFLILFLARLYFSVSSCFVLILLYIFWRTLLGFILLLSFVLNILTDGICNQDDQIFISLEKKRDQSGVSFFFFFLHLKSISSSIANLLTNPEQRRLSLFVSSLNNELSIKQYNYACN